LSWRGDYKAKCEWMLIMYSMIWWR